MPSSESQLSRENSSFSLHFQGPQLARNVRSSIKDHRIQPKYFLGFQMYVLNAYVGIDKPDQSIAIMAHHGDGIPPGKGKLLRKLMEMQLHQMPKPMEKVNTKHLQKHTQKKNVSVFTPNYILYSCHKTGEDFACPSLNCCPAALSTSQVAH